ncbi:unnamed protein product [Rhizoctonia solani]|uniref:Transcriptional regulator of RNA polII, SAGA, subunit n=1 Tax=Rhizoctonia solani TaxID=456999 RepID=A0A8H7LIB7_9AGAM|nr:Transcriptional regulator of RNA polII, SAGA, subunit [Rhizoctonia solani]CAE6473428.1 unnamed protein product [Rhizoctonia solani]
MVSSFVTPTSPLVIKAELVGLLGSKGRPYWNTLSEFIKAKISRSEFEERVTEWLNTPRLVSLHNSLLTALIYSASASSNGDLGDGINGGPKPRSRRRLLGHDKDGESSRLRRWAVDMGRKERERVRNNAGAGPRTGGPARSKRGDAGASPGLRSEIRSERGVRLMKERGNPPGTHLAIPLCESSRILPTQQNLFDRMSLIASQHDMTSSKTAVALLMTSLDAHLKHLSGRALDLSGPSSSRGSVFNPQRADAVGSKGSGAAMEAVLTLAPFEVPGSSASTLLLGDHGYKNPHPPESGPEKDEEEDYSPMLIDRTPPKPAFMNGYGFRRPDPSATGSAELWKKLISQDKNSSSEVVKSRTLVTGAA